MKPRKRAGENTKILIRAINPTGSTLREATDASGLHDDAARSYMRRCEMRGLVTVNRDCTPHIIRPVAGWEALIESPPKIKKPPLSVVEFAIRTQPNSVFALGALRSNTSATTARRSKQKPFCRITMAAWCRNGLR